jgi:hypothetical protein
MSDTVQSIEDLIERLVELDGSVKKLKTASVSGSVLRQEAKDIHKDWLPVCGLLEQEQILDAVAHRADDQPSRQAAAAGRWKES